MVTCVVRVVPLDVYVEIHNVFVLKDIDSGLEKRGWSVAGRLGLPRELYSREPRQLNGPSAFVLAEAPWRRPRTLAVDPCDDGTFRYDILRMFHLGHGV